MPKITPDFDSPEYADMIREMAVRNEQRTKERIQGPLVPPKKGRPSGRTIPQEDAASRNRYQAEHRAKIRKLSIEQNSKPELDKELRERFPEYVEQLAVLPEGLRELLEFRECPEHLQRHARGPCLVLLAPYQGQNWKSTRTVIWNAIYPHRAFHGKAVNFRRFVPKCEPEFDLELEKERKRIRDGDFDGRFDKIDRRQDLRKFEPHQVSLTGRGDVRVRNRISGCCAPWHMNEFSSVGEYFVQYRSVRMAVKGKLRKL